MSYQTILVYLSDDRSAKRVLKMAMELARKSDAHVIGLHVAPVFQVYSSIAVDLTAEILEAQTNALKIETAGIRKVFDDLTENDDVKSEWRSIQAHSSLLGEAVVNHARCADIVVAAQPDPDHDDVNVTRVIEQLLTDSGRPILLVPYVGEHTEIGKNITIAWNASREAARASAAALPLLQGAEKVSVLWVNPQNEYGDTMDVPGSEIATCLSRHGVRAETDSTTSSLPEIGDEILSRVADSGADLLVMGAYGHSRLREFIFGGASRHMLQHMTVPVLMAH